MNRIDSMSVESSVWDQSARSLARSHLATLPSVVLDVPDDIPRRERGELP